MKMIGEELRERNRHIEALNKSEANINRVLPNLKITITNPATIVKQKMHEMEDLFHKQEMEFYTYTPLGQLIREFLLLHLQDTIGIDLRKTVNFEAKITLSGVRLPIKNPYKDLLDKRIEEIKNFNIDETLPETLGKYMTPENLPNILFMDDDLIKLGYSDLAETAIERTVENMRKKGNSCKKRIKKRNSTSKI